MGKNFVGFFPSVKKRRMIAYESLLELDFIYILDFEPPVLDFEEQPFDVVLNLAGHLRRYTPDFLIQTSTFTTVIEVKPKMLARLPENVRKFAVAENHFKRHGWRFQVMTEDDIRRGYRLENIKSLSRYARHPSKPRLESRILLMLPLKTPGISIRDMLDHFSEDSRNEVTTTVFRLAFFNRVLLPLNKAPITLDTQITVAEHDTPNPGTSIIGW